jgi:hypothetical protein
MAFPFGLQLEGKQGQGADPPDGGRAPNKCWLAATEKKLGTVPEKNKQRTLY